MSQNYQLAHAFIATLTGGDPNTSVIDIRCIHDSNKSVPAHHFRGTLVEHWSTILQYQSQGYGIFVNINELDGVGRDLQNIAAIRTHVIDLDNMSAEQNYQRAVAWQPTPSFAVSTSPGKYHVYFLVEPYVGNDYYTLVQRKLRQLFDSDKTTIDPTRVMRLPGTLHLKNPATPHLVSCWTLGGVRNNVATLTNALAAVNVVDGGGGRHDLGDPTLAAPSIEWLNYALTLSDPNNMDRGEWIAFTAGFKQAGWSLADPDALFAAWSEWCGRYDTVDAQGRPLKNDLGENLKQWNSIRNSELGWKSIVNRVPSLRAMLHLDGVDKSALVPQPDADTPPPMPQPPPLDCSGEWLTDIEQREWFKGCLYVVNLGTMLTGDNRFLSTTQFNVAYGGKKFIIDSNGKQTNEAWAAATRSTLWTVPKVDHIRFLPAEQYGIKITDDMGRVGVNTYKPVVPRTVVGDPSPFLNHIAAMLPNHADQHILLQYLAHNVKFPGFKIPWAPVIQSVEGAGKGVLKLVMSHCMGRRYTYFPNAKHLGDSGAQFNAWMRNKLFILADEIKVDDRRDMIEVLKPMISEETIEIQGKGQDQDIEDNFANWCFFTNWRDAIPIDKNGRRFSIMFSALQTVADLVARGMGDEYFTALYGWLKADGAAIVCNYLLNYPVERGGVPMRAPLTSSSAEAVRLSRGPVERTIVEAIDDALPGFRGGWVSSLAVMRRIKETNAVRGGNVSLMTIENILTAMGYTALGRATRPYFQEDAVSRTYLYNLDANASIEHFGRWQGWE